MIPPLGKSGISEFVVIDFGSVLLGLDCGISIAVGSDARLCVSVWVLSAHLIE